MKKLLLVIGALVAMQCAALAQVVKLPVAVIANGGAVSDLGNGPLEIGRAHV